MKWVQLVHVEQSVLATYTLFLAKINCKSAIPGLDLGISNYKYIDGDVFYAEHELKKNENEIAKDPLRNVAFCIDTIRKRCTLYTDTFDKLSKKDFSRLTNAELVDDFKLFLNNYRDLLAVLVTPITLEAVMTPRIIEILSKKIDNPIKLNEAFRNIAASSRETEHIKEKESLLKIAIKVSEDKVLTELFRQEPETVKSALGKYPALNKQICEHLQKYGWTHFNFLIGEKRELKDVIRQVKNVKNAEEDYKHLDSGRKQIEQIYTEAIEKLKLSNNEKEYFKLFREVVFIRTYRLDVLNKGSYHLYPLFDEIGKRLNMGGEDVLWMVPEEIIQLLNGQKVGYDVDTRDRREHYALLLRDNKISCYFGKDYWDFIKNEEKESVSHGDQVEGLPVFPGNVKGTVKVVLSKQQTGKINKGDILITQMTTPDYITVIEKAAAIVTDLGGITSHAAVISREFQKPCIVGTKVATKIFKDGDLVEVDANRGTVRKLK